MAVQVREVWSDLHHDLIVDAQGGIKKVVNIEAVKTSIDNILRTSPGERVMLRDFGSNLGDLLFENINAGLADLITDDVSLAINTWDNRVTIKSINYLTDADRNLVKVDVVFTVLGYDEVFSFSTVV